MIHIFKIPNAQPTLLLGFAYIRPSHQAAGAMAMFLASPEKGAAFGVEGFTNVSWKKDGRHIVDRQAPKHGVDEHDASTCTEQPGFPSGKVAVERGQERLIVRELQLVWRYREPQLRLWKGGYRAAKRSGHRGCDRGINMHGHEG